MTLIGPCLLALLLFSPMSAAEVEDRPADRYDPAGRRDPFAPLVAPEVSGPIRGVEDLPWQKLVFVGILEDPGGSPLALFFGGPHPRSHFLRPGARFRNGTLERIDPKRGRVVIRGPRPGVLGLPGRHEIRLGP